MPVYLDLLKTTSKSLVHSTSGFLRDGVLLLGEGRLSQVHIGMGPSPALKNGLGGVVHDIDIKASGLSLTRTQENSLQRSLRHCSWCGKGHFFTAM